MKMTPDTPEKNRNKHLDSLEESLYQLTAEKKYDIGFIVAQSAHFK